MIRDMVVELVSPALVGGAKKGGCDKPSNLRPPSVRGQLGVWSRALGDEPLQELLFGSVDSGQRVRILAARGPGEGGKLKDSREALLIPSRSARAEMIPPGDRVVLRFAIPEAALLPQLQAVVWTWLHLGAVGRRSRRGYGSLLWRPAENDLLADWPLFWPTRHLVDRSTLAGYLLAGLERVATVLGRPGSGKRSESPQALASSDQVFVGKPVEGRFAIEDETGRGAFEGAIHGLTEDERGGDFEKRQLGWIAPSRLPSPMAWRVFPVAGGYLPVMTWFPSGSPRPYPQIDASSKLYRYLNGTLGFEESLVRGPLGR